MEEFGGDLEEKKEEQEEKEEEAIEEMGDKAKKEEVKPAAKALMQEEERATGSVDRSGTSLSLSQSVSLAADLASLIPSLRKDLPPITRMDNVLPPPRLGHSATNCSSSRILRSRLVARRSI